MNTTIPVFPGDRFKKMLEAARRHDAADLAQSDDVKKIAQYLQGTGRMDASESMYLARQLEQLRPGVMEVQYPELVGKLLVPVETNIDPGATDYVIQTINRTGTAKVVASLDTDIPKVEVSASEGSQIIRSVVTSYSFTMQEARASMMARTPLLPQRAMAARDAIERKLDNVIFYGETVMGLKGLLTLTGTETFAVPNGASGTKNFESKSPDEILSDLNGMVQQVVVNSKGIEIPDTMLLPLSTYTYISTVRMGDGDGRTVLQFFKDNQPFIKDIRALYQLEAAPAAEWTGKRAMCYRKDPNKLVFLLPVPFEQMAPQIRDFSTATLCHARTGGVGVFAPKSIAYADGV